MRVFTKRSDLDAVVDVVVIVVDEGDLVVVFIVGACVVSLNSVCESKK